MKKLTRNVKGLLAIAPVLAVAVASSVSPVGALCTDEELKNGTVQQGLDCVKVAGPTTIFGPGGVFTIVVNTLLFLIGAISVVMLIIGGIRYTLSGGKEASVLAAKNTIMYAIIGVIVALLAAAIVNFILTSLLK